MNEPLPDNRKIRKLRVPPVVVDMGKKKVISTHRFNIQLVADMMIDRGINRWVTIQELASFVYGNTRQCNVLLCRNKLWLLSSHLLTMGHILIKEPGHRPWLNIKIYTGNGADEREALAVMFEEMRRRLSAAKFERAQDLAAHIETESGKKVG